jgi:hypothetical protein
VISIGADTRVSGTVRFDRAGTEKQSRSLSPRTRGEGRLLRRSLALSGSLVDEKVQRTLIHEDHVPACAYRVGLRRPRGRVRSELATDGHGWERMSKRKGSGTAADLGASPPFPRAVYRKNAASEDVISVHCPHAGQGLGMGPRRMIRPPRDAPDRLVRHNCWLYLLAYDPGHVSRNTAGMCSTRLCITEVGGP